MIRSSCCGSKCDTGFQPVQTKNHGQDARVTLFGTKKVSFRNRNYVGASPADARNGYGWNTTAPLHEQGQDRIFCAGFHSAGFVAKAAMERYCESLTRFLNNGSTCEPAKDIGLKQCFATF